MKVSLHVIPMAALLAALLVNPVLADDNARAFSKLDVDGDGFITEYEALAHAELPDAFADGDENNDGQIDLDEFSKLEISDD